VVPEAGLEPAQSELRGILSSLHFVQRISM